MPKKKATVQDLLEKARRTKTITLGGDTGPTISFQALGAQEYDDLISKHPPTAKQKKDGATWNPETFAPALVANCSVEPKIDGETALQIWESESWSRGELMDLFMQVVQMNAEGLDVPFTGKG